MYIRELSVEEFTKFQENHELSNYHQTINYALLMSENGYEYDLIGYFDESHNLVAASLILIKSLIHKSFYGYAPRGFLIDYNNETLVNSFLDDLKKYYHKKGVVFIKINPNIKIARINNDTFNRESLLNDDIKTNLINNGCKKLKDNLYFEAQLPRFNAVMDLTSNAFTKSSKNTKNKVKKGIRKGLTLEKCDKDQINVFYDFIKNKKNNNEFYYNDYYNVFDKNNNIDLFLVSIDYNAFLENSEYLYNRELENNNSLNERLISNPSNKVINNKMNSDKNILTYKNEILEATKGINDHKKVYVAGALVIRHKDTATIVISGYDKNYKRFAPNYFLHYSLIKYYQKDFKYLDMNGVVGDFTSENAYSGLNRFKLGFNPSIYEYIGEFDFIIEPRIYKILLDKNMLAKEFNKNDIKS